MRDVFGILCTCFCFRGRVYLLIGWSFVELFRLYLGTSLCILPFLAFATLFLLYWVIHVRGSLFCVSCFKLLIDL